MKQDSNSPKIVQAAFTVDSARKLIPFFSGWANTIASKMERNPFDDESLRATLGGDRFKKLVRDLNHDAKRIDSMDSHDLLRSANNYVQEITPYFNQVMAHQKAEYSRMQNRNPGVALPGEAPSDKPSLVMAQ